MKKLLILLLSLPTLAFSQHECDSLILQIEDKMEGTILNVTRNKILIGSKEDGKYIVLDAMKSSLGELLILGKAIGRSHCIELDNEIIFLFEDGTRLNTVNNSGYNCKQKFTIYLSDNKKLLKLLKSQKLDTIRVYTYDGFVQEDLSEENSTQLMKTIQCLSEIQEE